MCNTTSPKPTSRNGNSTHGVHPRRATSLPGGANTWADLKCCSAGVSDRMNTVRTPLSMFMKHMPGVTRTEVQEEIAKPQVCQVR